MCHLSRYTDPKSPDFDSKTAAIIERSDREHREGKPIANPQPAAVVAISNMWQRLMAESQTDQQ